MQLPFSFFSAVSGPKLPEPPESKWKPRHHSRIYDYNYKVGESYYSPQTEYIGNRPLARSSTFKPPEAQTYAERFASKPIYGKTHGLPYDESESVFKQPLAIMVSGTRSRASSLSRDTSPESSFGSRLNRRRSLFNDEDFTPSKPIKKYSFDNTNFEPIKSSDLRDKLRKISDDFNKTPSYQPRKDFQKTEISFKQTFGPRGQPIIKREEVTYAPPEHEIPTTSYRRSSITDTSKYEFKPPLSLRTRRSSIGSGEEVSTTTRSSIRARKYTEDTSCGLPPRPARYGGVSYNDDDASSKFVSASQFRDARKLKESEELTENIQKMVNKMKSHHLDDASADIRSVSRALRATSLDPFEDDSPRSRSRQRARLNKFAYGVGKY